MQTKGFTVMATSLATNLPGSKVLARPRIEGLRFDGLMALLTAWFIGGLYLDGWAHSHIPRLETFFTPWHGVLYAGYFACAVALVGTVVLNHARGYSWRQAIPAGYEFALLGAPLFLVGGVADMTWHILFGIEKTVEALLSPTHLLLASSGFLIMSAPFRAAWRRTDAAGSQTWRALLPMLISLLATYSLLTFFTDFASPLTHFRLVTQAVSDSDKSYGVATVIVATTLLMGVVLLLVRRWQLPFGAVTFVMTLNAALMSVFAYEYWLIPSVFIAGLVADLLISYARPSVKRPGSLRIFAFAVPLVLFLGYFSTLMLLFGITWSIHLWLGASVVAGIIGLLLSYVMVPPQQQ
jgi:hypothetical protein